MPDPMGSPYADFWRRYLRAHARPATRYWHYIGVTLALFMAAPALVLGGWFWAPVPAVGYGVAWAGWWLVERRRPCSFAAPLRSLVAGMAMFFLWFAGRLDRHLRKAGVAVR